jgi:putative alpha-1,2-mannosidase
MKYMDGTTNGKSTSCSHSSIRTDILYSRILLGEELPAVGFKGYFVARFAQEFESGGVSYKGEQRDEMSGQGEELVGWVKFPEGTFTVEVRVGVSFISVDQARRYVHFHFRSYRSKPSPKLKSSNLDLEIPNGQPLETTSSHTRSAWSLKLDSLSISNPNSTSEKSTILYTSFAHTLVYPYEIHEPTPSGPMYYSGYLDKVVSGESYSGYSIWDTFRAQSAWLILTCPERVGGMMGSMLQDYQEGGWLPMWKNLVESNIMVGTHSDSIVAQAMLAGGSLFFPSPSDTWETLSSMSSLPPTFTSASAEYTST